MSDSRTQTYPSYRDDEPMMQRLAKCIAFELSAGGNAAAAAQAVMRDVRLGYINLPSPAWRDSIREAVAAERVTAEYLVEYLADTGNVGIPQHPELERHRLALDALLSGEG